MAVNWWEKDGSFGLVIYRGRAGEKGERSSGVHTSNLGLSCDGALLLWRERGNRTEKLSRARETRDDRERDRG